MKKNLCFSDQASYSSVLVSAFAVFAMAFVSFPSTAQITINSTDMPIPGSIYLEANDSNVTTAGGAGASQTWDFSFWENHGIDTIAFVNPSSLAGYSSFPSSNLGLQSSSLGNIFLDNSPTSLDILGVYGNFIGSPASIPFTPVQKFLSFPSTYQTTYNGATRYVMAGPYSFFPYDSVMIISNITYFSEIDGWGTITTPAFSNINSLRQKFTEIQTDSLFIHMSGTWSFSGQPPTPDTIISYRWWSDAMEFTIVEIQTDGGGTVTSAKYQVPPPPLVQISFSANPVSGCAPLTVTFTNTSSGPVFYQWNYGDGSSYFGSDTIHTHTYNAGGNYWVNLSAFDGNYNYLGNAYYVIYVGGSSGFFEMASDSVCPGDIVNFKGQDGALDYVWEFGDGATFSGQQWANHAYSAPGNYAVSLIITTTCGVDTIVQNIFAGGGITPETGFSMWPSEICPNQPVNLYSDPVGNNYLWNFGNGDTASGQFTTHSYPSIGTYTITCIVTNSCGNSSTSTGNISVVTNTQFPQGIGIYHWPQPACPNAEIYFGAPSDMASYIWDFGDGSPADTSASNELSHNFPAIGVYTVSVLITNYCGNDTTLTIPVNIENNVPFNGWFDMNINPSPACPGSTVHFDAWSNDANSFSWDFGDGTSAPTPSANHVYLNTGTYNASLTMTNSCGSDTTIFVAVNINNSVIPDPNDYEYGVSSDSACSGDSVIFYIAPAGSGTYLWNFGDGSSTTTSFPYDDGGFSVDIAPHVFPNNGTFTTTFTLTNQCGNSFTDSFSVTIGGNLPVDGDMGASGNFFCKGDTVKFTAMGGSTYVWNFGDGSSPQTTAGVISDIYHPFSFSGEYAVTVNITNSCGNSAVYSDTINIDSCWVGTMEFLRKDFEVNIVPNPNNGEFLLHIRDVNGLSNLSGSEDDFELTIFNILGKEILRTKGSNLTIPIDISAQPAGVYFLQLNSGGKMFNGKVVIE